MAKNKPAKNQPTVDDLKAPLLAAVGAADLALERVNEIVAALRDRAGEARTDAEARVEGRERVERYSDQAVELTQEALGNVASQTRAVGERAAKLVGVELPKKAAKAPAKKAPAKKAPAKKAPA